MLFQTEESTESEAANSRKTRKFYEKKRWHLEGCKVSSLSYKKGDRHSYAQSISSSWRKHSFSLLNCSENETSENGEGESLLNIAYKVLLSILCERLIGTFNIGQIQILGKTHGTIPKKPIRLCRPALSSKKKPLRSVRYQSRLGDSLSCDFQHQHQKLDQFQSNAVSLLPTSATFY